MGIVTLYYYTKFKPFGGAHGDDKANGCHVNKMTRAQFVTFKHVWRNRRLYAGWFDDWSNDQDYAFNNRENYFVTRAGIYDDGTGVIIIPGTNRKLRITPEGELEIWQDGVRLK